MTAATASRRLLYAKGHWHLHGGSLFSGLLHAAFAFRLVRRNW